jgi:hypothetical protein
MQEQPARDTAHCNPMISLRLISFPCINNKENRAGIEAEILLNVHMNNIAFQQSGVNIKLRLVHMGMDTFNTYTNEGTSTANPLIALNTLEGSQDVADLRDKHGADLVILF